MGLASAPLASLLNSRSSSISLAEIGASAVDKVLTTLVQAARGPDDVDQVDRSTFDLMAIALGVHSDAYGPLWWLREEADDLLQSDLEDQEDKVAALHLAGVSLAQALEAETRIRTVSLRTALDRIESAAVNQDVDRQRNAISSVHQRLTSIILRSIVTPVRASAAEALLRIRELDLSNNGLRELPATLLDLPRLDSLILDGNEFAVIPHALHSLPNLRYLSMEDNLLTTLADPLPSTLIALDLAGNGIQGDLSGLSGLTQMSVLQLSENELTEVPDVHGCPHLEHLFLRSNKIQALPEWLGDLSALIALDVASNKLVTIPESLGSCRQLTELYTEHNELESLPPAIGNLGRLRILSLEGNRLVTLPMEVANLSPECELLLDGNPLLDTMRAAAEGGTENLYAYLRSLGGQTRPCREAKLLVLGEGNIGKTSLLAALRGEPFVALRDTTHGIELNRMDLEDPDTGKVVRFNSWDFGGQEIYRVTHQFFFSQEAVFIVAWHPRNGLERDGVEYWVERIKKLVGARGVVILVSTYADEGRQPNLDLEDLEYRYYPLIAGHCAVDSESGTGIEQLKPAIATAALQLRHIEDPIAETWYELRERLTQIGQPYMSRDRYLELAADIPLSVDAASAWLRLLHSLGYVLYYPADMALRDLVILDPEVLAEAVSYVIEDQSIVNAGGVASHEHISDLWTNNLPPESSSAGLHPYLLRLMEKHEICYRIDDQTSLIAPVVPFARPLDLPWEPGDPVPDGVRQLSLVINCDAEPVGLISWLTVRLSHWSRGHHWRTGVLLGDDSSNSEALVEQSGRVISLVVRGEIPLELFITVRKEIEGLLARRLPFLNAALRVPCPGIAGSGCSNTLAYEGLRKGRLLGRSDIDCNECFATHSIDSLLLGLPEPTSGDISDQLGALVTEVARVRSDLDRANVLAVQSQRSIQELRLAVGGLRTLVQSVASDTPTLMSVLPDAASSLNPNRLWRNSYTLVLWCEHPKHEHPLAEGVYQFKADRDWFVRAAPMIRVLAGLLRSLPLVGSGYSALNELGSVPAGLDLMGKLGEAAFDLAGQLGAIDHVTMEGGNGLAQVRVFKQLLLRLDPERWFGGLQSAEGVGGAQLWICPEHASEYDPGLPRIAGSS